MNIIRFKRIPSTNTKAYQLAEKGAPEWTVVVAEAQTRGRGRAGKSWISPKGGLWSSILLRPDIPASSVWILQFLAANATRRTVEKATKVPVRVKWPNDIVLDSEKLGGILVESKSTGSKLTFVIVGIGLNVNLTPHALPEGATSLYIETRRKYGLDMLLKPILQAVRASYSDVEKPERLLAEWWQNCVHRRRMVQVEGPEGTVRGVSIGLDPHGHLLVEKEDDTIEKFSEGSLLVLGR
jgi:BirA family biotin operon repressor/biotin-[acetyl-CoA-carboxylase] ligase